MEQIDFKDFKSIELGVLEEFHNFCDKHSLRYYLCSGTLLGAVRHKGFIPWDDDIDVCMPRSDYDRFLALYRNVNSNYGVISFENNKDCWLYWSKMFDKRTIIREEGTHGVSDCGLYIDIFVLEGYGDSKEEAIKRFKKNRKALKLIYSKIFRPALWPFKSFLLFIMSFFINWRYVLKKMKKYNLKKTFDESKYVFPQSPMATEKNIYERYFFDKRILIEFEGKQFYCSDCYDKILKQSYGDYMMYPPENERVPHHNLVAFWKEKNC